MKRLAFILSIVFVAGMGMSAFAATVITNNGLQITIVDNDKKPCPAGCTCDGCKAKTTDCKVACDSIKAATCTKKTTDCTKKCEGKGADAKKGSCAKSSDSKSTSTATESEKK